MTTLIDATVSDAGPGPTDEADALAAVLAHDLLNDFAVINHLGALLAGHGHALDDDERDLLERTRNARADTARRRLGGLPPRLARRAAWELDQLEHGPVAGHACAEMLTDVARGLDVPLRVLVSETDAYLAAKVGALLERSGHEVLRCCESGDRSPRCLSGNGLADCPLDQPVDVAVAVRSPGRSTPRPREAGVTCSIRAGVPLVVAGPAAENPFGACARVITDEGHVVDACASAADGPGSRWAS
jgi:hypothetical protein